MNNTAVTYPEEKQGSLLRHSFEGDEPTVLSEIYQADCNIVTWKRDLKPEFQQVISDFLMANSSFQASMTLSAQDACVAIHKALGGSQLTVSLSEDIAELVDMFCCLFDLGRAGLRLTALDQAMCPRFHVDKVPCRLVTTYHGVATEWLLHNSVDRTKLGRGNEGKADDQSGLFSSASDIRQLSSGDVALLKGESWEGNEGAGLVHRSPTMGSIERRLLLTLDTAS
jgi:hypothetical protein